MRYLNFISSSLNASVGVRHPRHFLGVLFKRSQIGFISRFESAATGASRGRYLYPRRIPIEGHLPDILMSLIYHNLAVGDFASLGVQILDLSCEPVIGPKGGIKPGEHRSAKLWSLEPSNILSREQLNDEANQVYGVLMELANED